MDLDSIDLVKRIATGDAAAETELVQYFSPRIMFMLRQRTRDEQLAEDLHQDTLRIVIERLRSEKSLKEPQKLAGFVHKTALNVYIGYVRRESRRNTHANTEIFEYIADTAPNQLDELLKAERVNAVRALIGSLKVQRDRDVLHRFYVRAQDKSEICQHLDVTADNFDRIISRARRRFREALKERSNSGQV